MPLAGDSHGKARQDYGEAAMSKKPRGGSVIGLRPRDTRQRGTQNGHTKGWRQRSDNRDGSTVQGVQLSS
jgi:hypothetical protein